ncbi:MAG: STAS domain-containing protein [Phycisphaerae bacterium]
MKMRLVSIEREGAVKLSCDGSITGADIDAGGINPIQDVLGDTWTHSRIMLDMDGVSYVDSSAIGWLISTQKAVKDAGGKLVVYAVQPAVRQVLDLLKVGRVVSIVDSETEARDLLISEKA